MRAIAKRYHVYININYGVLTLDLPQEIMMDSRGRAALRGGQEEIQATGETWGGVH